jgi:hypothetical protein
MTLGERAARAVLRGNREWRTAAQLRIKARTLASLERLGEAERQVIRQVEQWRAAEGKSTRLVKPATLMTSITKTPNPP